MGHINSFGKYVRDPASTEPSETQVRTKRPPSKDRYRKAHRKEQRQKRRAKGLDRNRSKRGGDPKKVLIMGIDGEGVGRNPHNYTFIAASTGNRSRRYSLEAPPGERLATVECLDFILYMPRRAILFAYAFNYDLTKILTDLDNETLYMLARSELRNRTGAEAIKGPFPVYWAPGGTKVEPHETVLNTDYSSLEEFEEKAVPVINPYSINLVASKFTVSRDERKRIVWDIFKFYQSKFVAALTDWTVGNQADWDAMTMMKDRRGEFEKLVKTGVISEKQVREYCFDETACMAQLAEKLQAAHAEAGIPLTKFYGPGSSAGALLTSMHAKELRGDGGPPEMQSAVASAFFGGRFENSVIGPIDGLVWNYDISSAYPYQQTFLPCLLHGTWKRTKSREVALKGQAACIRYTLNRRDFPPLLRGREYPPHAGPYAGTGGSTQAWGPFPFREKTGSICFPIVSGGGWVWRDEFLEGERLFPHTRFREAWVYTTECDCEVFKRIPTYYLYRIKIGKEGAGIVIKLAINSCYGKLAQSVGNAAFNSWIWAGMITSGCRAQILGVLGMHKDPANLLMVATDGIYTRERLGCRLCNDEKCAHERTTPVPRDTGTWVTINDKGVDTKKPLGGWEEKASPEGVFVARPGIYFPRNPTKEEIKQVRGRGVGKGVVLTYWRLIEESYARYAAGDLSAQAIVPNLQRFCGMKTSISRKMGELPEVPLGMSADDLLPTWEYNRAQGGRVYHDKEKTESHDAPSYGEWVERQVKLGFSPLPKRESVYPDGLRLVLRDVGREVSVPYSNVPTVDGLELAEAVLEALEQPDADLESLDLEEGQTT